MIVMDMEVDMEVLEEARLGVKEYQCQVQKKE